MNKGGLLARSKRARGNRIEIATICMLLLLPWLNGSYADAAGSITRASVARDGSQADAGSGPSVISADGRVVAFTSAASNLVEGDTNGLDDVFVRDRTTGAIWRANVASDGAEANDVADSHAIDLSADGRFVAFSSTATNLVPNDTNGAGDVFVHDRATGYTRRASIASDGSEVPSGGRSPSISGDGRYVAFESSGDGLVPGVPVRDGIYVHDLATGKTEWASAALAPFEWSSTDEAVISGDGRYVSYRSSANLPPVDMDGETDLFVFDRVTGSTELGSPTRSGHEERSFVDDPHDISNDGRYLVFASPDTGPYSEVVVYDRESGELELVSVSSDGDAANDASWAPTMSDDGRFVAFLSRATNLALGASVPGLYVHDRRTGMTTRVPTDDANSTDLSRDGRFLAFTSGSAGLVPGDTNETTDAFVYDQGTPLDVTPPRIEFSGNAGHYTVDQLVSITCSASDEESGVASEVCEDVIGPAYDFEIGTNTFAAHAIDNAGNSSSAETSFTVEATPGALSNVVEGLVTDQNLARSLLTQLGRADVEAFINHVEAQRGKRVSAEDADLLIELVRHLS